MQIKAADSRQPDIVALERLLDRPDVPAATRKRIEAEIRQIRAGEKAEQAAAYQIELYFGRSEHCATIHDLRIEVGGLAAQIDHVIINRLAEVWLCESKSFAEGVSINEYGEWLRWWNGRSEGFPSPIEQNRRHIFLLQRVFDDGLAPRPRRFGIAPMKPRLKSLVLVSDSAKISRPRKPVAGLEEVIKAEQLKTRLFDAFDATPDRDVFRLIGKEGLEKFARGLAGLHRPASVDWPAQFGLTTDGPEPSTRAARRSAAPDFRTAPARQDATVSACNNCGRGVSDSVVRYCEAHADEFEGVVYCMRCQPLVRARMERPITIPPWTHILERYRTPTRLRTVARQAPFIVVASGQDLTVTPGSSERARTLTRADFERAAPLLGRHGRAEVNEASRNSSYVQAILAELRGSDDAR